VRDIDVCVFAGRFRPFHEGHHHVIKTALEAAQYLFIFVGSINEPVNYRNPFTFEQVREMIRVSLHPRDADRVFIFGVEDMDSDLNWVSNIQKLTGDQIARLSLGTDEPTISLIGFSKDASSYYLELFPQWKNIDTGSPFSINNLSATSMRNNLYETIDPSAMVEALREEMVIPMGTFLFLREWVNGYDFERLRDEYRFMEKEYLPQFPQTPYPRFFNTADACVIMGGQVLLVRRGERPGKGLWALPGGHVQMHETFEAAAIRELEEETTIGVERDTLRLAVKGMKLCDDPWRSTRMRTVSVAFGFRLIGTELPPVLGADDAHEARWWNINEVTRAMMFEDHYLIIEHFANRFRD
jgi:bifunctional NMN adenylyltransferase/nudix hydrolase